MATKTSVGSGLWSAAGTWDAGVPADGDDVVIASGHTVTFDVDQSAFVTGVKITITGTLTHTTASGSYCLFLKTGASIVGAGTWNIGTSGTPIPFASKHLITGASGWIIDGNDNLTINVCGAEPSIKVIRLSGAEAAGQTVLSVDTDVTGDIWAVGDEIGIAEYQAGNAEVETRTIAAGGIASGTITVTAGLSAEKKVGAFIVLLTRNIRIVKTGTDSTFFYRIKTTSSLGCAEYKGLSNSRTFQSITGAVSLSGGVWRDCQYISYIASFASISNTVFYNIISGVFNSTGSVIVSACYFAGCGGISAYSNTWNVVFDGCYFYGCSSICSDSRAFIFDTCTFLGGNNLFGGTDTILLNCTLTTYMYSFSNALGFYARGCTFSSSDYHTYRSHGRADNCSIALVGIGAGYYDRAGGGTENVDIADTIGAYAKYGLGGSAVNEATVVPSGYAWSYKFTLASASYYMAVQQKIVVPRGVSVSIEVQLRKSASMVYLPKVFLMSKEANPLNGETAVDMFTMTDSIDTWETDTFTIDNSAGTYDKEYTLWFIGKNATGNMYSAYKVTVAGGSGGAVSIVPCGGIRL